MWTLPQRTIPVVAQSGKLPPKNNFGAIERWLGAHKPAAHKRQAILSDEKERFMIMRLLKKQRSKMQNISNKAEKMRGGFSVKVILKGSSNLYHITFIYL